MDKVSTDDWIIGGVTLLLIIDLLFLPWFSITVGIGPVSVTATSTATGSPDGWLGILAVLALIALLADLLFERFSPQTQLPVIGGSREQTRFVLACVATAFIFLKFLFHIHFSLFGFGFWGAVVLTAILMFASIRVRGGQSVIPSGA
jgi:hypothetical protein